MASLKRISDWFSSTFHIAASNHSDDFTSRGAGAGAGAGAGTDSGADAGAGAGAGVGAGAGAGAGAGVGVGVGGGVGGAVETASIATMIVDDDDDDIVMIAPDRSHDIPFTSSSSSSSLHNAAVQSHMHYATSHTCDSIESLTHLLVSIFRGLQFQCRLVASLSPTFFHKKPESSLPPPKRRRSSERMHA